MILDKPRKDSTNRNRLKSNRSMRTMQNIRKRKKKREMMFMKTKTKNKKNLMRNRIQLRMAKKTIYNLK